jgi:hypothetical protein
MAADVEFFWDPMCPWAWITSRWVESVAAQRDLDVDWRFISLRLLNDHRDYATEFPAGYPELHGTGLKLLRVAAAVRDAEGPGRMGAFYTRWGGDIHVRRLRKQLTDHYDAGFPDYLRSTGVEDRYLEAANDERWDQVLKAEKDEALSRTGPDVGTPIISFTREGVTQSFFGPVINEVPPPDRAVALWDAVWELATFPGFAELKRSLRGTPQLATSLG